VEESLSYAWTNPGREQKVVGSIPTLSKEYQNYVSVFVMFSH
jgi:hypothetical protein